MENLIAIKWELLQHRRMRDAGLRKAVRRAIRRAVVDFAPEDARDLADRAVSTDEAVRIDAFREISQLGV